MNAPYAHRSPGEALLLATMPSEAAIARMLDRDPSMTREAAIKAVQRERVQRFREHRAGEHRGASAPTSLRAAGSERVHLFDVSDRLANATVERCRVQQLHSEVMA